MTGKKHTHTHTRTAALGCARKFGARIIDGSFLCVGFPRFAKCINETLSSNNNIPRLPCGADRTSVLVILVFVCVCVFFCVGLAGCTNFGYSLGSASGLEIMCGWNWLVWLVCRFIHFCVDGQDARILAQSHRTLSPVVMRLLCIGGHQHKSSCGRGENSPLCCIAPVCTAEPRVYVENSTVNYSNTTANL